MEEAGFFSPYLEPIEMGKTSGEHKKAGRDGGKDGEWWSTERSWDYTHERDIRTERGEKFSLSGLERDALALRC